jgi:ATP-dependent Lon protease
MKNSADTLTIPVLPLKNSVLFPQVLMPLSVGRPGSVAAIEAAVASEDKTLAIFVQTDGEVEEPKSGDLFSVGTLAVIRQLARASEGLQIVVHGTQRVELVEATQQEPFIKASVRRLPELTDGGTKVEALHRAVMGLAGKMIELVQPQVQVGLSHIIGQVSDPLQQIYLLASLMSLEADKEKALLAASSRREVLQLMHAYLHHEVQVLELRNKITSAAQTEIGREQREYYLRQQLRAIQEELGEQSPEVAEVTGLRQRLNEAGLPEIVHKEVEKELARLERTPSAAADYQITRTYVELAIELPWNKATEDRLDLNLARTVLDEDHFDLQEVKQRIIEHLAVMKLNPRAKAPILCFVGPPGVGKTSLGQSIARALDRKFERMSLGGLHDEAELRGHRRTYIGAMPGRIIQAIRRAGVNNPLLMLDEVDKLGQDFRGDPAAALMEILDPAQNAAFHDNYLDLPFDLSRVFFITTANTLESIPRPLLDRMEVLRLAGYSDEEKREIARRYLVGRQVREAGLTEAQLSIPDETVNYVIRRYTREAGVRELERVLGRIARKVATRIAEGRTEPVIVRPDDLPDLLGPERFFAEQARQELPPGVAAGLAWTEVGGEVLYVEAVALPGRRGLTLTGQLGQVMRESARAARSYLWSHATELGLDADSIQHGGLHIHVPAGAIPKDGPSAGVAMVTALASLYSGHPARSDTAMTGEITLSGLVFPVGGVKEKILAARRAGIRRVILPQDNEKDLLELPEGVRAEIEFVFARRIEDVLAEAIPGLAQRLGELSPASALSH